MDLSDEVHFQNLTWEEVRQRAIDSRGTIILPIGSTEQHGPHLPVGTDTMLAVAVAEAAARKTGVLVAPPLWFGWSPHHLMLPGTITIHAETLIEFVYDMLESLYQHDFTRFIILNGHRIVNVPWMQIAAERAKRKLGVKVVIFDPAYMSKEIVESLGWGEIGHAEEIEGSHMWYCCPELVKMDRAKDNPHQDHALLRIDPRSAGDTLCYVPSSRAEQEAVVKNSGGTIGEPHKASRGGGQKYHQHLVKRMVEVIQMIQDQEDRSLNP